MSGTPQDATAPATPGAPKSMPTLVRVYKSAKVAEMFLYVRREDAFARVPKALLEQFGEPELAMTLPLRADRQLAQVAGAELLRRLRLDGFYLQLPPPPVERDEHGVRVGWVATSTATNAAGTEDQAGTDQ